MRINMQIVLSQADISEAIRLYLRREVPLSDDTEIAVVFDNDGPEGLNAVAVVDNGAATPKPAVITRTTETDTPAVRERGKPSPGRGRRTQAEIAEDEAADKADAEAATAALAAAGKLATNDEEPVKQVSALTFGEVVTTAVEATLGTDEVDPAIRAQLGETVEDNDPPFDVDSKTEQTAAQVDAITAPVTRTSSIFPNEGSSAPAIQEKMPDVPPAAASPKSLFAGLGTIN